MVLYGQRLKVARINVEYELEMMVGDNSQLTHNGKMAVPVYLGDIDNVLQTINEYVVEAALEVEGELLGGNIRAEFLGQFYELQFTVLPEGETRCKNYVRGTSTIH